MPRRWAKGGVDIEGFTGDALAFFRLQVLQRAHVVEAVGELDEDDADVGDHGQQHLADVFCLMVFAVGELDLVELGDAFYDVSDLLVEALGDLRRGDVGIFYGVVQEAGCYGCRVHLEVGQDLTDFQGMNDVRLAGGALLVGVLLDAEGPGSPDDLKIVTGAVFVNGGEEMVETGFYGVWRGVGRERLRGWMDGC